MRLRVLDINTRWFWFVCFYRKSWSGCVGRHIEATLYGPQLWTKSWLNFWKWEPLPDMRPKMATEPANETAGVH